MKVGEIMTRDVSLASLGHKLRDVAAEMKKRDIGVLPVVDKDRLVGMITDRDIAVRGISQGHGPEASVGDVMSTEVKYCFESDEIGDLAQTMADEQIRRLPVLNEKKRLVGIVSLGDLATGRDDGSAKIPDQPSHHAHLAKALSGISKQRRRPTKSAKDLA